MRQLIRADGHISPTYLDKPVDLDFARELIRGHITITAVPGWNGAQLLCDEEGLPKRLAPNLRASVLAKQEIVGDVVLLTDEDVWK